MSRRFKTKTSALQTFELRFAKTRLSKNASQRSGRHFPMLRNCRCQCSFIGSLGELYVTPSLTNLNESGRFKFTLDLRIKNRSHAALTSISSERTCGAIVATGGVK